jgi:SWI/SNF-related matrix-associated actin-dependent regulator 1 of chromatin subfamily A
MELYEFQKIGAEFLSKRRVALLADSMGVGKTIQAIAASDLIHARRVLVVCPSVAKINWVREFEKWGRLGRTFRTLDTRKDVLPPGISGIASYNIASELPPSQLGEFDLLVVDEAHFLKSHDAKRTKAILGKEGLIHRAKRTWLLTGTPMPNHAAELWPMLFTFGITKLTYTDWVKRYCTYYRQGYRMNITGTNPKHTGEIRAMLGKVMLRRRKEDVLPELPPITFQNLMVPKAPDIDYDIAFPQYSFPPQKREELIDVLEEQEARIRSVMEKMESVPTRLETIEAMAKSVAQLRVFRGLQKVPAIVDMVREELEANAYPKIVLFAIHRVVINQLRDELKDFHPLVLWGGITDKQKQQAIDRFQKQPKYRVFIGNIHAAGPSITLTAANQILFAEQSWTPGDNAQAAMRCHRIGQKNAVNVRVVSLEDPLDERIQTTLMRKTKEITEILD